MTELLGRAHALIVFLYAWSLAHPALVAAASLAAFNALFKPKTPEAYDRIAKFSPRLAALLQLIGAIGIDPAKAQKVAGKLVKGLVDPGKVAVLVAAGALLATTSSCTPEARWALADLLAEKTACAVAHMDMSNEQILLACAIEDGDAEKILKIVGKAREKSAEHARAAATRAADEARKEKLDDLAGCLKPDPEDE